MDHGSQPRAGGVGADRTERGRTHRRRIAEHLPHGRWRDGDGMDRVGLRRTTGGQCAGEGPRRERVEGARDQRDRLEAVERRSRVRQADRLLG